jgi:hypothetical protein
MYFIVLLLLVGASSTAYPLDRSSYSRRARRKSTAEANYFYFGKLGQHRVDPEMDELRKSIRFFQILDAISFAIVLAFTDAIIFIPSTSKRWGTAPGYVRDVYYSAVAVFFIAHLVQGPYRGRKDLKAYLHYYQVQGLIHSGQAAFTTYAFLWLIGFSEFAAKIRMTITKVRPWIAGGLGYLLQIGFSGIVGNFAYDLIKRKFQSKSSQSPARRTQRRVGANQIR